MTSLPWTAARVETLETLWLSGLSASQVAAKLGGVTRNAVIGKLHRLGIAGRAAASAPGRADRPHPENRVAARRAARERPAGGPPRKSACGSTQAVASAIVDLAPSARDLLALGSHQCRWPIGDPATPGFGFCGRADDGAGPYCADHARRAYRGAASRLDRDPFVRRLLGAA